MADTDTEIFSSEDIKTALREKAKWSKIKFYSCLAAAVVMLAACLLFIISINTDASKELWLGIFISLVVLIFAAVIVAIVSIVMAHRFEKIIAAFKKSQKAE